MILENNSEYWTEISSHLLTPIIILYWLRCRVTVNLTPDYTLIFISYLTWPHSISAQIIGALLFQIFGDFLHSFVVWSLLSLSARPWFQTLGIRARVRRAWLRQLCSSCRRRMVAPAEENEQHCPFTSHFQSDLLFTIICHEFLFNDIWELWWWWREGKNCYLPRAPNCSEKKPHLL